MAHIVEDEKVGLEFTKLSLLAELHLNHLSKDITLSSWKPWTTKNSVPVEHNPLRKALRDALEALPPGTLASLNQSHTTVDLLVYTFPESYSVYKPLLLLPSNSIGSNWHAILSEHVEPLQPVWQRIAAALQCTHIALNSPIPPSNTPGSAHGNDNSNILRSPVNLIPIYGSFGPPPTSQTLSSPTHSDFSNALWVRTTQNGIHQTWAPLYTMFSRGNVKEKARILHLPSVTSIAKPEQNATAVDMYAGIGYFSFSYRKAGLTRVLCWELNPWSVEGLRRGAALNSWSSRVFTPADVPRESATEVEWETWRCTVVGGSEDIWIFQMSNDTAQRVLQCLRTDVPPVRHVNLGLLPVSRLSWPSAVHALDKERGGWIHAHENVGLQEMDEREVEVLMEFQRLADERTAADSESPGGNAAWQKKVEIEHVERVKMYAPGVVHAVFDMHVPGKIRK
ncbi:hypothetical protein EKO04_007574 [Ascochyta lentis]|uniref:tRNA wybutosine-synthesizing protein 2 n=1 Tax=Ascochyta lentis TaxID=205686 RepID=A0A8H7J198_9PLEO|nr:hypothetical protein EKO04_007574 [Ascochyta lentis]